MEGEFEPDYERRLGHSCADENVPLTQRVCNFFFLNYDLLRQNLHGIDTLSVFLTHLEYLTEGAFANELKD